MKKGGTRAGKYEQMRIAEKLDAVRGWAMHGGQNAVAKMLGVSCASVSNWKGRYPEFAEALKDGEQEANGKLLHSAFSMAFGYEREVTELLKTKRSYTDAFGNKVTEEEAHEVRYMKYFPPSPQMAIFMLENRMRNDYTAKPEPEEKDETNITIVTQVPRSGM